jgi:indolepyruvate ferredoxin oxidoreductase
MLRAIELNGVAVQANKTAFALGRLAIAAPAALQRLGGPAAPGTQIIPMPKTEALDGPDGLISQRVAFLAAYQNTAHSERYRNLVERVRSAELALGEPGRALRLTRAVAQCHAKLLAIKDEYEVARLYTNGDFERALQAQFERWDRLSLHLAPPLFAKPDVNGRVKKIEVGPWMLRAMRLLARCRGLRGTPLDPFGHTAERRLERQLITDYEALIDKLLAGLSTERLDLAVQLARNVETVRGYGHVKLANVATARARQQALLGQYEGRASAAAATNALTAPVRLRGVTEL